LWHKFPLNNSPAILASYSTLVFEYELSFVDTRRLEHLEYPKPPAHRLTTSNSQPSDKPAKLRSFQFWSFRCCLFVDVCIYFRIYIGWLSAVLILNLYTYASSFHLFIKLIYLYTIWPWLSFHSVYLFPSGGLFSL